MEEFQESIMVENKILELNRYHYENCQEYADIINSMGWKGKIVEEPMDVYLHSAIFKHKTLKTNADNIEKGEIILTSSGTTGKNKSKIHIDFETKMSQQKALRELMINEIIGEKIKDIPYYIIGSKNILRQQNAKYAAVKGFSLLSKKKNFLYNEEEIIDNEILEKMMEEKKKVLLFGFTYDTYKFLEEIKYKAKTIDIKYEEDKNNLIFSLNFIAVDLRPIISSSDIS